MKIPSPVNLVILLRHVHRGEAHGVAQWVFALTPLHRSLVHAASRTLMACSVSAMDIGGRHL